jgi:biotin-(acetyl-CoA carboxylase) ligase
MVAYNLGADLLQGAMVFAPEVPLSDAVAMLPVCGVGFQNALGALAPPEVAVHLEWDGVIRVNGAQCGKLSMAASTSEADTQPDWLVVGLDLPLWPKDNSAGGETPDQTTLYSEGCVDVAADALLEAWARHTLNWIGRWEDEGVKPVHSEWRGLAHGIGESLTRGGVTGTFVGVDERFGLLFRVGDETRLIPLTEVLEGP